MEGLIRSALVLHSGLLKDSVVESAELNRLQVQLLGRNERKKLAKLLYLDRGDGGRSRRTTE